MKGLLIFLIGIIGYVAFLLLNVIHTPKFQIGDCVTYFKKAGEFTPEYTSDNIQKVIKIGKKHYLLKDMFTTKYVISEDEEEIVFIDKTNIKVECPQ